MGAVSQKRSPGANKEMIAPNSNIIDILCRINFEGTSYIVSTLKHPTHIATQDYIPYLFTKNSAIKDNLPIVRTPSKTLERPLGLVFLVYRGETKRAVLPNEITSLDTVRALFVRSFAKTLTMAYMDIPRVHIYIHDRFI